MCVLEYFTLNLQELLCGTRCDDGNIIRKHSRKLEQLGEISFPLNIKNWYNFINRNNLGKDMVTIFDYNLSGIEINTQIDELKEKSKIWQISIKRVMINDNDAHLFLERSSDLFEAVITEVLNNNTKYGSSESIQKKIVLDCDHDIDNLKLSDVDLSTLRKRTSDMRMMAQHKYGVQVKPNTSWENYFEKLGKAAVTIEMLSNKPHKALKTITPEDVLKAISNVLTTVATPSINTPIKNELPPEVHLNRKIIIGTDETLGNVAAIDMCWLYITNSLLASDVESLAAKANSNIGHMKSWSSGACLALNFNKTNLITLMPMDPREHLFAVLHARIYLLKALQCVFHNSLGLLNIEPIKEM
ncbi:hypothetical protein NQ314_014771 [Rhamnusium bicolor]|uniref:DALR anticodon binding domain-containing protein n=1 Tax=Rhamnusium bicolor TaxID=1586634 RepID=A0AAV8X0P0_9CUCU|nr:hypothetical protein NQ314_014771 [Rhamnusium bicolor]